MSVATDSERRRKPAVRVGDVVVADGGYWYLVTAKDGQHMRGRLLARGIVGTEHRFTSRSIERVYRELPSSRVSS